VEGWRPLEPLPGLQSRPQGGAGVGALQALRGSRQRDAMSYRSGCQGKSPFVTWDAATVHLKRIRRRRKTRHAALTVYRCAHCAAWHIGGRL
jgi:hypothetical protein